MRGASERGGAVVAAVAAVVGAAAAAGGSLLTWWSARWSDALTGPVTTVAKGSDVVPELLPVALVGLAGWAAAAATRGGWRRVIGGVLALAGAWLAVRSLLGAWSPPEVLSTALVRPAEAVGEPWRSLPGPALAVLGALLLSAAGVLSAVRSTPRRARAAAGGGQAAGGSGPARPRDAGDTTDDWWKDLDAGTDPTARPPAGP